MQEHIKRVKLLAHRAGLPGNVDMIIGSALAGKFPLTPPSRAGLTGHLPVNECFIKAEVLRELGKFESAKQVLSRAPSKDRTGVVRQLRSLCDAGDTCVRELHFSE
jgi:hypothetical protein